MSPSWGPKEGGAQGSQGIAGFAVLNGVIPPVGGDGVDGDFFIDTATSTLYGPKAGGVWPAGVPLIGPAGGQVYVGYVDGTDATVAPVDLELHNLSGLVPAAGDRVAGCGHAVNIGTGAVSAAALAVPAVFAELLIDDGIVKATQNSLDLTGSRVLLTIQK